MPTAPAKMLLTAALVAAIFLGSSRAEEDQRAERIFAYYSTTSITLLTTTTITGLSTCFTTGNAATVCQGRKKRSKSLSPSLIDWDFLQLDESDLNGSLDGEFNESLNLEKRDADPEREGKKLTIWSTNFTTITITSTSIIASTTITASAMCVFPGNSQRCFS